MTTPEGPDMAAPASRARATADDAAVDELAGAITQVLESYRSILGADVTEIRSRIERGQLEEAVRALEHQQRSLETAAACLTSVVADATHEPHARAFRTPPGRYGGGPGTVLFLLP